MGRRITYSRISAGLTAIIIVVAVGYVALSTKLLLPTNGQPSDAGQTLFELDFVRKVLPSRQSVEWVLNLLN